MPVLRIVAGSYERLLFGYAVDAESGDTEQLFGFGAHVGCIKSVAISARGGGTLITGGQDELIKVYSLRTLRSLGELFMHQATVCALASFGTTHVMSGDEQGKLVVWRTKDWEPLTTLKGHKYFTLFSLSEQELTLRYFFTRAAILGIAFHPSGKLALTVSADRQLFCWNLLRGLKATRTRLHDTPVSIHFSPSGSQYTILFAHSVVVYDTVSTKAVAQYDSPQVRLNAVSFVHETQLVLGCEDGAVLLLEMSAPVEEGDASSETELEEEETEEVLRSLRAIATFVQPGEAAGARVKAVSAVPFVPSNDTADEPEHFVAAACSTGAIAVWRVPAATETANIAATAPPLRVQPIARVDAKCRLTCLALDVIDAELVDEEEAALAAPSDEDDASEEEEEVEEEVVAPIPARAAPKNRKKRSAGDAGSSNNGPSRKKARKQ
ncbi:WD40-repeat-containing domain protein [Blastocladiella britannica]|nr:WD40-repeat-containing domain protein [Blastocladiella britannica]